MINAFNFLEDTVNQMGRMKIFNFFSFLVGSCKRISLAGPIYNFKKCDFGYVVELDWSIECCIYVLMKLSGIYIIYYTQIVCLGVCVLCSEQAFALYVGTTKISDSMNELLKIPCHLSNIVFNFFHNLYQNLSS